MKTHFSKFFISILLFAFGAELSAQQTSRGMVASGTNAEKVVSEKGLHDDVEFISDTLFHGRAIGSKGANEIAFWLTRRFTEAGLRPMNGSMVKSFTTADGTVGRNIVGFQPGRRSGSKEMYVIVAAHYDSHGEIDGRIYPGADNNASGVAALVSLARMFSKMESLGRLYGKNLIFVATDGGEKNSAGAEALMADIKAGVLKDPVSGKPVTLDKIHSAVVLDIIGSSLAPVSKGREDFLIMLSGGQYTFDLARANEGKGLGLELATNYYGSKNFTDMFLNRVGDQRVFASEGLTHVLFTSGITMRTNKVSDTIDTINFGILRKRIFLIFHWLEKIL